MAEISAGATVINTALSLAKIPFQFAQRLRQNGRVPQDQANLYAYHKWLEQIIDNCISEKLADKDMQKRWRDQLNAAKSELANVKSGSLSAKMGMNAKRNEERLKKAEEILDRVKDQVKESKTLQDLQPDCFKQFFYEPELLSQSFWHCENEDDSGGLAREGKLRELVTRDATANVMTAMYCALGPGGMGKTVALQWLCCDKQVKKSFRDGIQWFSFGEDLDDSELLEQIRLCARCFGYENLGEELRNEKSTKVAIDKLGTVFEGKRVLFVIDDVWEARKQEVMQMKKILSKKGNKCSVVISCRDPGVAEGCDEKVSFEFLDAEGEASRKVLLSCLERKKRDDLLKWVQESEGCRQALQMGVKECGGWILCLSIAGAMLREELNDCCGEEEGADALSLWAASLEEEPDLTSTGTQAYPRSLHRIVRQSLKLAEQNLLRLGNSKSSWSVAEKFYKLCVMPKQGTMPVSVLMSLWNMTPKDTLRLAKAFRDASLVELKRGKESGKTLGRRIQVHDKVIDLCREQHGVKRTIEDHRGLLKSLMGRCCITWERDVTDRPWTDLSVDEDDLGGDYISANMWHHLEEANLQEVLDISCDARFFKRFWNHELRAGSGQLVFVRLPSRKEMRRRIFEPEPGTTGNSEKLTLFVAETLKRTGTHRFIIRLQQKQYSLQQERVYVSENPVQVW